MNIKNEKYIPATDWLTIMAIAAIAISFTIAFHEGVHAITCIILGGDLQEYSALHVECESLGSVQDKIVSGSASVINVFLGLLLLILLQKSPKIKSEFKFFFWLMMVMNLLNGAGYWAFSGVGNVGDWANVISGWEPHWLWRTGMAIVGFSAFMYFVWIALHEFGKIIGGDSEEQISRASKLGILSYISAILVVALAGINNPYGLTSLPVVGGLLAVLGGMSPLIWMMQWFRASSFVKTPKNPLEIHRKLSWIITAFVVVFVYSFILGRTIYF